LIVNSLQKSGPPGTRRDDDAAIITAFHQTQEPIHGNDFSPALGRTSIGKGASVRRLTPRECERLQGLPDDWTAYGPDSRRYAGLGDAVSSPVGEWIGLRIMEAGA
jgi:DNA (cytosine-5)-methyltransferase 1